MVHPIVPPQAETLRELGTEIGKLRYDALIEVLDALSEELDRQKDEDAKQERYQITDLGADAVIQIHRLISIIHKMLRISIRYMRKDIASRPLRIKV